MLRDRLEEFAAILCFPGRGGRHGNDLVDPMGFGETPELRQHLEGRMPGLRRERTAIEPASPEADHFFLAVDDLK
jgi:hypothetical protein